MSKSKKLISASKNNVALAKKFLMSTISSSGSIVKSSIFTTDMFKIKLKTLVALFAYTPASGVKIVEYFDERWPVYVELLQSSSPSEFILKFNVYQMNFQLIDYYAVIVGFAVSFCKGQCPFDPNVVISLIDKKSVLDDALKNPKLLKMIMKTYDNLSRTPILTDDIMRLKKVTAHILVKFPDLKKMNFMFKKSKKHAPVSRFTDEDIATYF